MPNDLTRRRLIALSAAALAASSLPAAALTDREASALVQQVVDEINRVINSGKSEAAMYDDFANIFRRYADVDAIARSTLGPPARTASAAQLNAYADAFTGYLSRKYGKRFRELIGGEINVEGARPVNAYYEVQTVADLRGEAPFSVSFMVSDRSGRDRFFDLLIEGISLLKTERTEVGAMLDRRRGDIDALIADLRRAG